MKRASYKYVDVTLWSMVVYLALYLPSIEMRVEESEQPAAPREQQQMQPTTTKPESAEQYLNMGKCFRMTREQCPPPEVGCSNVSTTDALFCCDINSTYMKDNLGQLITQQKTKYLHVLNGTIKELDVSQAMFRRLTSMAFTDGNIEQIVGQFPKYSAVACLNISNNNLTSTKLQSAITRPYAYLFNLTVLDASANNLTEFPLSLVQSNRKISVNLSGNNHLPCKSFEKVMETNNISLVTFLNYNDTFCALNIGYNWFKDTKIVKIDFLRVQKELNASCRDIRPANINCTCDLELLDVSGAEVTRLVAVDCTFRNLTVMPTNLPANTVLLNVSYNNITSLQAVSDDSTYDHLRRLVLDHNDIPHILDLEGTKFIDNFNYFSIAYNKLKTIHTYVLSNRFDTTGAQISLAGNYIHCDCNTAKTLKPWLLENAKNLFDYKQLSCQGMASVVDLAESQVCHTPRDWTDYIYYIIALEVLVLVLLVSKVSYDYWVFKTAGYLPWPANKMPRLPCDWLCE